MATLPPNNDHDNHMRLDLARNARTKAEQLLTQEQLRTYAPSIAEILRLTAIAIQPPNPLECYDAFGQCLSRIIQLLGPDTTQWHPFYDQMHTAIHFLNAQQRLSTPADCAHAYTEIADGLSQAQHPTP